MSVTETKARSVDDDSGIPASPVPVYLASLELQNIRCFGPGQVLDLTDTFGRPARWTVILGDNGVGKTTLLQCLAKSTGRFVPQTYTDEGTGEGEVSVVEDKWRTALAEDHEFREVLLRHPDIDLRESVREAVAWMPFAAARREFLDGKTSVVRFVWSHGAPLSQRKKRQESTFGLVFSRQQLVERLIVQHDVLSNFVCYAYGASRRMSSARMAEAQESDTISSLFFEDAALVNAEEWLLQADYAALVESPEREYAERRRDTVRDVLIELLPDVRDIRFVHPSGSKWAPRVEVQTPYGWVHLQKLSLGYRTLIAWIVDLAYRMFERHPESPNPLAEPAVVLVDEIDLHLHPKWQRTLIAYLTKRFPNTQFIVTAHSPLVVQAAAEANIVLLRRSGDHVVIDNEISAIRNWRVDQVLTSDLFGLPSARPPRVERLIVRRNELLSKSNFSKADQRKLEALDSKIGELPVGETPDDIEAMDIIREAAAAIRGARD